MHTIFEIAQGRESSEGADAAGRAVLEERIANEGFRGRWYPLTASRNVGAAPLAIDRMGERIVLWRDAQGAIHAQEDRCPHRGARLSQGRVRADAIVCPYHGIAIDADGRIASVPALPGCPIEGRLAVRTYAVQEIADAIFAYFPTPAGEAPIPLDPPSEFTDPAWSHFLCETTWSTNYRYAIENVIDPMHGPYLHGDSHSMSVGAKDDVMEISDTAHGFRIERKLQKDVAFDWTEYGETGALWMRLDIPYPVKSGPGGPFRDPRVRDADRRTQRADLLLAAAKGERLGARSVALSLPRASRSASLRGARTGSCRARRDGRRRARARDPLSARCGHHAVAPALQSDRSRTDRCRAATRGESDGAARCGGSMSAEPGENVPDARYSVHSLELGLRILESFDRDGVDEMSLSEMARRIGVSRSSAFRLVHTLQRLGYLEREDETKNYRLGARVMSLGYSFLASKDIAELARPDLQRLRNATRCSTHLGILDGAEVIYIARFAAHKPVSAMIAVGARVPAHATTMGRIILAYKPAAYVRRTLRRPARWRSSASSTPVTLESLTAVLEADRRRGYVISHSNFEAGIASIAAPLFDAKGEVIGAINVSTPENAIEPERFDRDVCDELRAAARRISELSGYREPAIAS